ncbi:MAG: hypothetical protein U1D06_05565 [Paracoccaceae bacterium]|nr:hypothetical protein [Paracoccaceae bacterium]
MIDKGEAEDPAPRPPGAKGSILFNASTTSADPVSPAPAIIAATGYRLFTER